MTQATSQDIGFKHFRNFNYNDFLQPTGVSGKGGVTVAYRHLTEEELVSNGLPVDTPAIFVGFAACSSADNYDKKQGRKLATQRLAVSKNIFAGDDLLDTLIRNDELAEVEYFISGSMISQGLRVELCL